MSDFPAWRGLHHVTAITAHAAANLDFYTRVLGLRLVKKTVNQDDVSAYHLFYADELGRPGTDLTFFDWPHAPSARPGAGTISETAFRILGENETLDWWRTRFDQEKIAHGAIEIDAAPGSPSLSFRDPEGQHLRLIAEPRPEDGAARFHPWRGSSVPPEAAIVGLASVNLTVRDFEATARMLTEVLGFHPSPHDPALFEIGAGGPGARLRLLTATSPGTAGAGGVHHVAWTVANVEEQWLWLNRLARFQIAHSGLVDRHYFQSVYFRIPGGILFEIATEGPGFTADGEDLEHLGERLSLPPFLEKQRAEIEAGLKPLPFTPPRQG